MTEEQFIQEFTKRAGRGLFTLLIKSSDERSYFNTKFGKLVRESFGSAQMRRVQSSLVDGALSALTTPNLLGEIEIFIVEEAQLCSKNFLLQLDRVVIEVEQKRSQFCGGIVLSCSESNHRAEWTSILKKSFVLNLCSEKPWQMHARWQSGMQIIARQWGIDLTHGAAALISQRFSNSRLFAESELERLSLYVGKGGMIDEQIVDQMASPLQQNRIWPLVRSVEKKSKQGSWKAIESLPAGEGGLGTIAGMRSHFEGMLMILESNSAPKQSFKENWRQQLEQQKQQSARALGKGYLMNILRSLHAVDEACRLGELQPEELLQAWFFKWIKIADE